MLTIQIDEVFPYVPDEEQRKLIQIAIAKEVERDAHAARHAAMVKWMEDE